jgi:hypothetical protein
MRLLLCVFVALLGAACPADPPAPKAAPAKPVKPAPDARADIPKRTGPIVLDGVANEADWASAPVMTFASYDGKSTVTRATSARMLWDDEALYVSFTVDDPDPFTLFTKRDDPIYDSEATEIFIDADGDRDEYVELQSTSNDLHFDASFQGGARQRMNKAWDAAYETKTARTDKGYVSEWRIPVASLRDIPAGEPKVGAQWKINLFRLERIRASLEDVTGKAVHDVRVKKHEASAWSPPLSGDFHTLERFGTITFK